MVQKTLNTPVLPTRAECIGFWEFYKTPQHIRRHMEQVNRVAMYIAHRLQKAGKPVIVDLVDRASLLHDTVRVTEWKTLSFEYFPQAPSSEEIHAWEAQRKAYPTHIPHALVTAEVFQDRYPELARVIAVHSIGDTPRLKTWEEKIVNYADRRVSHDRIVTVQERLDEAFARYSQITNGALERDPKIVRAVYALEKALFDPLHEDPNQLMQHLIEYESAKSTSSTTATANTGSETNRESC